MNQYFSVSKTLFNDVQEMKKQQEAIPHYVANTIELGDLESQTKCEIMRKVKHNIDEIDKQYKNEDSKGWISTCSYTRFSNHEKYVYPALDYVFNLKGLSKKVNDYVEGQLDKAWYLLGKDDSVELTRRKILSYIRGVADWKQQLVWVINEADKIEDLEMFVNFTMRELLESVEGLEVPQISQVNLYLSNGKSIRVVHCDSSVSSGVIVKNKEEAENYMTENLIGEFKVKLSNWDKELYSLVSAPVVKLEIPDMSEEFENLMDSLKED